MTNPKPNDLPDLKQDWHSYSLDQTIRLLDTNTEKGLTNLQVSTRQKYYGLNQLTETGTRQSWEIFLDQFKNIMLLMLIAVAIISGILDLIELQNKTSQTTGLPFKDAIAILSIVLLNGILGYFQESRAEKALLALKKLSAPKVQVIRNSQRLEVDASQLVPGDIILLEAGSQLCADGIIINASPIKVRESALTGEANAVNKEEGVSSENTPLGERFNMVYNGTEVLQGRAKVVVTGTGMNTELGKIAQMLQSVENEDTPLQQRMTNLANVLVITSLILVGLIIAGGIVQAGNLNTFKQLVETSLSMAVAVVPEGLPVVITLALAIGTQRMVKRMALIRKLPAVETLGSVNVICSDKTGTLTENKMMVQQVKTITTNLTVTGFGYTPQGEFFNELNEKINPLQSPEIELLLLATVLCNDASLIEKQGQWEVLGDPTEGALITMAAKTGIDEQATKRQFPRVAELPFSSERQRMSVICENLSSNSLFFSDFVLLSKGSPESILSCCQYYQQSDRAGNLTSQQQADILESNNHLAQKGLRVLGFAYKSLEIMPREIAEETTEKDLVWLGLVAMIDPPRLATLAAVNSCREAGIRPIMITGDHQLTAMAIAMQLGIVTENDKVITGRELEELSQAELEKIVEEINIYARVSPEHKLRIVQALKKRGKCVAMTGDGVNDAPALKQADIGISMGITGTDVSKEASDMVLLDDNFATIVAATEEGRVIFSNIRRFIKYILGGNIGEVITIIAAPILGLAAVPLTPLQILWMNLVTDGLPALALAVEPAEANIMRLPPFHPKESIFARGLGYHIVRIGIIFSIITITLMIWGFDEAQKMGNPDRWQTMVFTTLCLGEMGLAIAVRSDTRLTIELNLFSNPYLLISVVVTTILQLMLIYVPPLREFFETEFLSIRELIICIGFSSLMFVWVELEKLFIRWYRKCT